MASLLTTAIVLMTVGSSAVWLIGGFLWLRGMRRIPVITPKPEEAPSSGRLAIILAACNEADTIGPAIASLIEHAPADSIVVAVDDRSDDGTGDILDTLSRTAPRLCVRHVRHLPEGWLGKTHALEIGASEALSRWGAAQPQDYLLFTDADVVFRSGGIDAAVRLARERGVDHLLVFPDMVAPGFWERVFVGGFVVLFGIAYRVWAINHAGGNAAAGIGAFNLVRAQAYLRAGGHRSVALEVADDVQLGKRLRGTGARPLAAFGADVCRVRWQHGLSGHITGLTKNAFSGFNYSLLRLLAGTAGMLFLVWPFAGVWLGPAWSRLISGVALAMIAAVYANGYSGRKRTLYFLTYPLGTLFFLVACWRSALVTLIRGGVEWRGTHYPLGLLRERPVPPPLGADSEEGK